jgi:hypothetical protein
MRRIGMGWLGAAASLLSVPLGLAAQRTGSPRWGVGVAAGVAAPTGRFSVTDNPGPSVLAFFSYRLGAAFSLGMDVGATWTPHKVTGTTELYDALVGVVWRPPMSTSSLRPFILGSVGSVAVDINDPDQGRPALSGGAGVLFGRGNGRVFVLGRYIHLLGRGPALAYVPITVGFSTRAP